MRTVLDAYALIAFVLDEPAAPEVERILRTGDGAITSVNHAEVLDRLIRGRGMPEPEVTAVLGPLLDESLVRVAVDFRIAHTAAQVRVRHYHRTRAPLSLADCICLAAAKDGGRVATADRQMLEAAEAERIPTVPLGSSTA